MSTAIAKKQAAQVVEIASPYALIESAVANGASIETLEKLMTLQERYEANNARKQFYAAMQQFQSIKPELKRSSNVNFSTQKGTTNYNFCALPDIDRALKEPLDMCGLSYRFENFMEDNLIGIRCIVSHVSGHSESTQMKAPTDASGNKNSIQSIGSTSTYLQRYTLIAAFGLTTADDDDDGAQNSDLPLLSLLKHNHAVRDNLPAIMNIKKCIAENDMYQLAVDWDAFPATAKEAVWIAPTKGGIFTTKEIAVFRSNEYASARADYFAEKQSQEGVKS
jgi:hypothetical protein